MGSSTREESAQAQALTVIRKLVDTLTDRRVAPLGCFVGFGVRAMAPKVNLLFHCELCQKSYARISELETHESSYDHHHRKRAADLRIVNRDSNRRKRESENDGVIRVLGEDTDKRPSSKRTKRGFKSTFTDSKPERVQTVSEKPSNKTSPVLPVSKRLAADAEVSPADLPKKSSATTSSDTVHE